MLDFGGRLTAVQPSSHTPAAGGPPDRPPVTHKSYTSLVLGQRTFQTITASGKKSYIDVHFHSAVVKVCTSSL